jgi:alanyl-tRNA synthetase
VKANNSKGKPKPGADQDSLPPEIVLKVMQALRDEIKLREETRETQTAKPAVEPEKYESDARELSAKQDANSRHTQGAVDDIRSLQDGAQKFSKELQLLDAVVAIMDETTTILHAPDTGPKAIAAETEAIELLLQAKRQCGGGGGGGGSNPGGGGSGTTKTAAALAELGPGGDAQSQVAPRAVGQATGRAGKEFPDEFKPGLEAYFNLLEGGGAQK